MLDLDRHGLDVLHNNSLHHLPVAMAAAVSSPVVTTLHVPPTPWLGPRITYAGHLCSADLATLVASAEVALVTPLWEEPYGLVVAEALACGTPVAALPRGAIPELIDAACGCVADHDSVDGLVRAVRVARRADARACRAWAVANASVRAMAERYCDVYASALAA